MKKSYLLIGLLLMSSYLIAQKLPPVIQWQKSFGGSKIDRFYTIIRTLDNGYLAVGESFSNDGDVTGHHGSTDSSDAWVVKLDTSGSIQWQRSYGGSRNDRLIDVIQAGNGDFICVGSSESDNGDVNGLHNYTINGHDTSNSDLWAMRISSSGSIIWSKLLGGTDVDAAQVIRKASDGAGYVIAGNSKSTDGDVTGNHGYSDIWLLKINENGLLQWQQSYGNIENQYTTDLIVTSDGNYVISGYSTQTVYSIPCQVIYSYYNAISIKVTPSGASIWQNIPSLVCGLPGPSYYCSNLIEMPSGQLFYVGNTILVTANNNPYWLLERMYSNTGQVLLYPSNFSISIDPRPGLSVPLGITTYGPHKSQITPDSSILSCAEIYNSTNLNGSLSLIKTKFASNINNYDSAFYYGKSYGGSNTDVFEGIEVIDEQQFIAAGFSNSNNGDVSGNHGDYDCWLVKFSAANKIKGKAFIDANANGIKDGAELYAKNYYVESKKNGLVIGSTTDNNGNFLNNVDTGSYTTTLKLKKPYYTISPVSKQSTFATLNKVDSFDFALVPIAGQNDLQVSMQGLNVLRPGFSSQYRINYSNAGSTTISNTQIQFIKPTRMNYSSAVPLPLQVSEDTITWNTGTLAPLDSSFIILTLQAQPLPGVDIGNVLSFAVQINPITGDQTPADNRDTIWQVARSSYDPNDKAENYDGTVYTSQLNNFQSFDYTIRFQNTGTDTAFSIILRDTLSNKLDPSSLQIEAASHPYTFTLKNNKYCTWTFSNIKLADINTNEPLSHGYISYRIKPFSAMMLGDTIKNSAVVYFDFNPGVQTNNQLTVIKQVLPPPPIPVVTGLQGSYCNASGLQKGKITNLPLPTSGTTVIVKLDTSQLSVAADSTFSFNVSAITAGAHTISVSFTNISGADTMKTNINVTAAVTPDVNAKATITNITNLTDPVVITASNAAGGGTTPRYTFATDRNFTNVTQTESSNNQYTVNTSSLPMGDNWVFVKMKTSDTCYTAQTNIDSIKLYKLLVPDKPTTTGANINYCSSATAQKVKITNIPPAGYQATVIVSLDGSLTLPVATDSTFNISAAGIAIGNHTVIITFNNASGSNMDTINFSVTTASTPHVNVSANITTVVNLTDAVIITASNTAGGGTSPKYTFAKDKAITNIVQTESSTATLTIQPNTLTVGANWIYIRMKTSDTCYTSQTNIDSIDIERSTVTGLTDVDFPTQLINVYPNPFAGIINISGLNTGKTYSIVISNAAGQKIYNQQVSNSRNFSINKTGLQSGKYWLTIYDYKKHKLIGTVSVIKE